MSYEKNTWKIYNKNVPDVKQPDAFITKDKLDNIEQGIYDSHQLIIDYAKEIEIGDVQEGDSAYASIVDGKLNLVLPKGEQGIQGPRGEQGEQGPRGLNGKSAYQIWLEREENYGKTEDDFLNSMKVIYSNYDIWLAVGYEGTPYDFIEFLRGDSAYQVWLSIKGNEGKSKEEFFKEMQGIDQQQLAEETTARVNGDIDTLNEAKKYIDEKINEIKSMLNLN